MRISLGLLGAAAFMVIADARVIDPLLRIIADEYQASVGSTAIIVTAYTIPLNILLGLGFYMLHSTLQTKATEMFPEARGTAVALFAFGLFIGQGIGAAALGLIVDGPGYAPAFAISGIAILLLAFWLVNQMRRISLGSHNSSDEA